MAVNIDALDSSFAGPIQQLLTDCANAGYRMVPTEGIRSPVEQSKLWRQSRSSAEVQAKIAELRAKGYNFLAECIERAGPSNGEHVTNAIGGLSWHQWGEAVDCVWVMTNGRENWSVDELENGQNGYRVYAQKAEELGLNAGGHWHSLKDWPHVQLRADGSPLTNLSMQEINDTMLDRFGP